MARSDGSEPRKLVTTPGRAFWVRWSPDGARLRFTLMSQGYAGSLWEISAEGHDLRAVPLARGEHDLDCCGEWSPDSRHFFFRRIRDNRADIWAIRERKGLFGRTASRTRTADERTAALCGSRAHPGQPAPAGHRNPTPRREPAVRSGKREFAPYHAGGAAGWFAFSRDGQWVAYIESRERHSVAQQSRWQRATPAHPTAAAAPVAALVAGWHAPRLHGTDARTALEDLRHSCRGGRTASRFWRAIVPRRIRTGLQTGSL